MEILAPVTGIVWYILVDEGDVVSCGDTLIILESMQMEVNIDTAVNGRVAKILRAQGETIFRDEPILVLKQTSLSAEARP